MKIHENPRNIDLKEKYHEAQKKFNRQEGILKRRIFGELDKEKKEIEVELENKFYELWDKHGDSNYSFDKLKVVFDPIQYISRINVIKMTTPDGTYDLENIALNFPKGQRKHGILESDQEYRNTCEKMKEYFVEIGLAMGEKHKLDKPLINFLKDSNLYVHAIYQE